MVPEVGSSLRPKPQNTEKEEKNNKIWNTNSMLKGRDNSPKKILWGHQSERMWKIVTKIAKKKENDDNKEVNTVQYSRKLSVSNS